MRLGGTPARLGAYAAAVALVFASAFAVGAAAGPVSEPEAREPGLHAGARAGHGDHDAEAGGPSAAAPAGLARSEHGYTLVPARARVPSGPDTTLRFHITRPDGRPLRAYTPTHERELHLVMVRRDMSGYQHVHPERAPGGGWSVPLDLSRAGVYRVFADFVPTPLGEGLTLGTDVSVAGGYRPAPLPRPDAATRVDGYDVTMHGATPAGRETTLAFTVSRHGRAVRGLQPYLGAFGHLVSLRAGDLAYLHTHATEPARRGRLGGPTVRFTTEFPTPGAYRLFLDFVVGGEVRTAAFTVRAGQPGHDGGGDHGSGDHS